MLTIEASSDGRMWKNMATQIINKLDNKGTTHEQE
jgi:hypothetical protein